MHAARPSYAVRHSRSVLLVIIAALLLGLVPAAHASPPDPTWIGGYWDDDDFDNAVILIVSTCVITAPPAPDAAPQRDRLAGIELAEPAFILASPRPAASPRAPPIAFTRSLLTSWTLILARRTLVVSVTLLLLNGVSFVVHSQELPESRRHEKWRLSWNIVDRGFVSWGTDATVGSLESCSAAQEKAVQRKKEELQSLGNDVTENDATILERRRADQAVLTVVRFSCIAEKDWIIVIAHQPRGGAVSEDRIGPFPTEENCIDVLELEVDFKAKSLKKLGNYVSAVRSTTTDWTVSTKDAFGTEAGPLKTITTYRCISE